MSMRRNAVVVREFSYGASMRRTVRVFFAMSVPHGLATGLQVIDDDVELGALHAGADVVDAAFSERELVSEDLHAVLGERRQRVRLGRLPRGEHAVLDLE